MGHKTNPIGIRLGITADWQSRWFANPKLFRTQLRSDVEMHDFIMKKWKQAAIASVQIERSAATIRVIIETSRPGVLIGRGGTGIEDLARVVKNHFFRGKKMDLKVEVKEVAMVEQKRVISPLEMLGELATEIVGMAEHMKRLASRVEDVALAVEQERESSAKSMESYRQLKALLKSLQGEGE